MHANLTALRLWRYMRQATVLHMIRTSERLQVEHEAADRLLVQRLTRPVPNESLSWERWLDLAASVRRTKPNRACRS